MNMKLFINTERLTIRLAETEDAISIISYRSDFIENKYQGWFPNSVEEVCEYISNMPRTMLPIHIFSLLLSLKRKIR